MKRIDIGSLLAAVANIALFSDRLANAVEGMGAEQLTELKSSQVGMFIGSLAKVVGFVEWLELPSSTAAAEQCRALVAHFRPDTRCVIGREKARQLSWACHQLQSSLSAELEKHHAYIVAPREGRLIDDAIEHFGIEVVTAFPQSRADINAGSRCRAYELWTASVMHMMRVAEIGVGALADHLGVKRGNSWGVTIAGVMEALRDTSTFKGDPEKRQWGSETGSYLAFVKDAFRNPAMHPERTFGAEEAIAIYDNTRLMMRALARRLAAA